MVQIAICDDEEYFCEREKNIILAYMEKKKIPCEITVFSSGRELLESKSVLSGFQVIFLDVSMNDLDGIETAKQIRGFNSEVFLVFVTAFVTYALEGYKVDAIRYIIKDDEMLENAIYECIDAVLGKLDRQKEKVQFAFREGVADLAPDQILYVESDLHRLSFYIQDSDQIFTMNEKLDVAAKMLESYNFCRIHKSFLVNLKYVEKIERYQARLYNGAALSIAKPRYPEVRSAFLAFKGDL